MFNDILKAVGPMVAAAMAAKAGEFDKGRFRFEGSGFDFDNEFNGKPLEELDLTAEAPTKLVLFGPDKVRVTEGAAFRVKVEGDAAADVRFSQKNGTLAVMRARASRSAQDEAVITVTMPAPQSIVIAGSGTIEADRVAPAARINIAGSGAVDLAAIDSERLKINIMGSGRLRASGRAERMKLNIAGSGLAEMAGLEVERAKVSVAGSGNSTFASDGEVEAHLVGSGLVTVHGRARCSVQSMGAGKLRCVPRENEAGEAEEVVIRPHPKAKPKKAGKKAAKTVRKAKKAAAKASGKAGKAASKAEKAAKPRKQG